MAVVKTVRLHDFKGRDLHSALTWASANSASVETADAGALDTLNKIRQMTWAQLDRDKGQMCEKIIRVRPPQGMDVICSLRITQSRSARAFRDGESMRLLTVAGDHDSAYGKIANA
jgi:hypothetical protein